MRIPRRRFITFDPSGNDLLTLNSFMDDVVNATSSIKFGSGLSGGSENVECDFATVTFATAGTEVTASHNLGRVPVGVWLIKADHPGDIYISTTATSSYVYLKCDCDSLSGVIVIV